MTARRRTAQRSLGLERQAPVFRLTIEHESRLLHARARARRTLLARRRSAAAELAALSASAAVGQSAPDLSARGLILYALDFYESLVADAQSSLAAQVPDHRATGGAVRQAGLRLRELRARIAMARAQVDALAGLAAGAPEPLRSALETQADLLDSVLAPALAACLESMETESEMLLVTESGTDALHLDEASMAGQRARLYPQYLPLERLSTAVRHLVRPQP